MHENKESSNSHKNSVNSDSAPKYSPSRLSVAPMPDWTDRHGRYFHRQLTRQTLLYTEMV
ncbi:tRNA dihydrouridine(20/20a) synthase DusA, partial [Erwinia amylovora]|uniref:tRNA-dihydrouridine synthase n=1 Tax=Erwinia amylovora TaxID=552 RepID=UPI001007C311